MMIQNGYKVNKLKCSGHPVNTCVQLYEYADIIDLLLQKDSFITFANTHLKLDINNDAKLIDLLKKVCRPVEWKTGIVNDISSLPSNATEYLEKINKHCSSLENSEDKENLILSVAIISALARIDLEKEFPSPKCLLAAYRGEYQAAKGVQKDEVCFGNEKFIYLSTQNSKYTFSYNPTHKLKEDGSEKIQTYCICIKRTGPNSNVQIVFSSLSYSAESITKTLNLNDVLYVNVVGNTVVSVLPKKLERSNISVVRDLSGFICVNGKAQENSQGASSFDISESGECLWVRDGKLGGTFRYSKLQTQSYANLSNYVEVCFKNNNYYLLESNGHIWSSDRTLKKVYCNASLFGLGGEL